MTKATSPMKRRRGRQCRTNSVQKRCIDMPYGMHFRQRSARRPVPLRCTGKVFDGMESVSDLQQKVKPRRNSGRSPARCAHWRKGRHRSFPCAGHLSSTLGHVASRPAVRGRFFHWKGAGEARSASSKPHEDFAAHQLVSGLCVVGVECCKVLALHHDSSGLLHMCQVIEVNME